jgi:hypothetical protein
LDFSHRHSWLNWSDLIMKKIVNSSSKKSSAHKQ